MAGNPLDAIGSPQPSSNPLDGIGTTPQRGHDKIDTAIGNVGSAISGGIKKAWEEVPKPLQPVITHAARAVGTVANPIVRDLTEPMAYALAKHAHGGNLPVYTVDASGHVRANPQAQSAMQNLQANTELATRQLSGLTEQQYNALPGWRRAANEFATQFIYDPLSLLGGLGLGEQLTEKIGTHGTVNTARAIKSLQASSDPRLQTLGQGLADAFDKLHYKGQVKRDLAAQGPEGIHQFNMLKAINNARKSKQADLEQNLLRQYHQAIQGLSIPDEARLYEAVHTGGVDLLPPNLKVRAAQFKNITDQLAHFSGDPELRQKLGEAGFTPPANMQRFEPTEPRGIQTAAQYREHYVPTAHDAAQVEPQSIMGLDLSKETGSAREPIAREPALDVMHINEPGPKTVQGRQYDTRSLMDILMDDKLTPAEKQSQILGKDAQDKFLLERGEGAQLLGPQVQRKIIESRLKSGARAISAADAEREVTKLFGKETFAQVPNDAKAFFMETYKGNEPFWKGLVKGAIDIPKVGLFAMPFRHMANIGSLLALASPTALPQAAGKYLELLAKGTGSERLGKYLDFFKPENAAARRHEVLGKSAQYGVTGAPAYDKQAGWVGKIPVIGDVYKASNHLLWTFDDAAKATRFNGLLKRYQRQGLDEAHAASRAAAETGAELIDYSNNSPLTEALRYIAPFATYRSKLPGAIAQTALKHPERIRQASSISPELVGELSQAPPDQKGKPQVGKSYLPLAEVMRGVTNPWEYARSTLGYPGQIAASVGGVHESAYPNYFTYGKVPDAKYLANALVGSFPGGSAALGAMGQGEFQDQGSLSGSIRSATGFGLGRGPSQFQIQLQIADKQLRQMADQYRRSGNAAAAKQIEYKIQDLHRRYQFYQP